MGLHVDHIIYAVRDLDAAASRFEHEFGFGSVEGGRHLGWGTAHGFRLGWMHAGAGTG